MRPRRGVNLAGQIFGRLTVIEEAERHIQANGKPVRRWLCRCECGNEKVVAQPTLSNGHVRSCGCLHRDTVSTHGLKFSPLYKTWVAMRQRCFDENCTAYPRYGGRGITICERWGKFENFLADMGERPEGNTLDRIDNSKGYEPSNCRWATNSEQQRNRDCNKLVLLHGRQVTAAEAADRVGLPRTLVYNRLRKGWPIEKVLSTRDYRSRDRVLAVG
jgi:hypothetical protein